MAKHSLEKEMFLKAMEMSADDLYRAAVLVVSLVGHRASIIDRSDVERVCIDFIGGMNRAVGTHPPPPEAPEKPDAARTH